MAKMFDKVSQDFMNAIKGVLEAKKVNKHGHDHVGKEDDDIDNDGDTDASDKYLHNRRKAIGKSMMKKESKDDVPFKGPYGKSGERKDEYGNKVKNVAKHLAKKAMKANEEVEELEELSNDTLRSYRMKAKSIADHGGKQRTQGRELAGRKSYGGRMAGVEKAKVMAKEEADQIDELSTGTLQSYADKASDAGGHRKLSTKKVDNRYKGVATAAKKLAKEDVEQVDELSKPTMGRYINKAKDSIDMASYRQGNKEATGSTSKPLEKKLTKRHKGIETAVSKLTKEEIEMIEAKMAGVAPGSMEGDKHMCATKVFHKEWNEGTPIKTMHADPDAEGLIEWYDVMFDHGIERVMTEDMEILQAESHMHSKKKMKEETAVDKFIAGADKAKSDNKKMQKMLGLKRGKSVTKGNVTTTSYKKEEAEELDEARGRPKKTGQMDYTVHPKTKEKLMHNNPEHMKRIERLQKNGILEKPKTEANQHIMNQLQKAKTSMQGGSTIQFTHGSAKHVSGTHAAKLLDKYAGMKPDEKEAFQKKIGHSHEQLMKHV